MIITLKNIGPLTEASFDLDKGLIVFTGPNNTGKTYAAYIAYACNRMIKEYFLLGISSNYVDESWNRVSDIKNLNIDLYDCYIRNKDHIQNVYADVIKHGLRDIFDTTEDFFRDAAISLNFDDNSSKKAISKCYLKGEHRLTNNLALGIEKSENETHISYYLNENIDMSFNDVSRKETTIDSRISEYIQYHVITVILQSIFRDVYFAPTERTAINLFSQPILLRRNNLLEEATKVFREKGTIRTVLDSVKLYSLPIRDNLQIAGQLREYQKKKSDYAYIADIFEAEILHGGISVSEYGEMQYNPQQSTSKIGIHLSGSVVKSLSSLVFYFRHIAQHGDLVIIDEPELNLHPDNQRKVARILGRIVNAGFKVIISTHSDYIIRELNNLMMLSKDHPEAKVLREKYGYEEAELLDHHRVGAYLFMDNTAQKIEVDEQGMESKTIDAVIKSLNNSANDIYWTLFED